MQMSHLDNGLHKGGIMVVEEKSRLRKVRRGAVDKGLLPGNWLTTKAGKG